MTIKIDDTPVYVTYVSEDLSLVLATKDKTKKSGVFKLEDLTIKSLDTKDLDKLKKFKR